MEHKQNQAHHLIQFEGFTLDPVQRVLKDQENNDIVLTSRALDILSVLVQHPGEVISKSQLLQTVWPNTVVDENNISQAISAVRKALKDKNGIIITVPGRGYSFTAKVKKIQTEDISEDASETPQLFQKLQRPGMSTAILLCSLFITTISLSFLYWNLIYKEDSNTYESVSLAIYPLSSDNSSDDRLFADRLTEELISQFTLIEEINVSSLPMINAGNVLAGSLPINMGGSTTHTLTGTVRQNGEELTITMQLIENENDFFLWSDSYSFNFESNNGFDREFSSSVVMSTLEALKN